MKKSSHICFNGELFPAERFSLDYKNRAFKYGDGLFETMRSKGITIPFYNAHFDRLQRGMELLKLEPVKFNKESLLLAVQKVIHADKLYNGNSIRITVFRTSGGKYTPESNDADFLIEIDPIPENRFVLNEKGLFIDVYETHYKSMSRLGNYKNCSSLLFVMAGLYKKEHKLDDLIILNERNFIAEALSSNVFFSKNETLFTPSLNTGCVDGVMRKQIIQIAKEMSFRVVESDVLEPEDMLDADEVFLTNALRGISWVVAFKNKRYLNRLSRQFIDSVNSKAEL